MTSDGEQVGPVLVKLGVVVGFVLGSTQMKPLVCAFGVKVYLLSTRQASVVIKILHELVAKLKFPPQHISSSSQAVTQASLVFAPGICRKYMLAGASTWT